MLDDRSPLILAAAPAGLAVGLALWLAFARAGAVDDLAALEARLKAAPKRSAAPSARQERLIAEAAARPIFALTTGPGAVDEVSLQLLGVSRSGSRTAALLSINGEPAEWLEVGATRQDLIVRSVSGSSVLVDTPLGVRDVKLGQAAGMGGAAPVGPDEMPPGFRSPPPPASAPGMSE